MPGFLRTALSGRNPFVLRLSVIAAIGGFLFGYDTGVISGTQLYNQKDLGAGTLAQSWIIGSLLLGAVVGAIASGYLADRISRKWTKFTSGAVGKPATFWIYGGLGVMALAFFAFRVPETKAARWRRSRDRRRPAGPPGLTRLSG
jgi:MFS family permease